MVTEGEAVLYTDGRYFLQAEKEMYPGWTLMRMGLPDTPSEEDWLKATLPAGGVVGVDPTLIAAPRFRELSQSLKKVGRTLVAVERNLVDEVWDDQPSRPTAPVIRLDERYLSSPSSRLLPLSFLFHTSSLVRQTIIHPLLLTSRQSNDVVAATRFPDRYAGVSVTEKMRTVRAEMETKGQEVLLLSKLDEVAWLLNLRGSDIVYNPVFFAYVVVLPESAILFCDAEKLPAECTEDPTFSAMFEVQPYANFVGDLTARNLSCPVWVGPAYSYAVKQALQNAELLEDNTPVCTAKAIKNPTELEGMRQCHLRDAVALCEFFLWIEGEIASGRRVGWR